VIGNDLKIVGQGLKIISQVSCKSTARSRVMVQGAEVIVGERAK
jgi:hypothetical protein